MQTRENGMLSNIVVNSNVGIVVTSRDCKRNWIMIYVESNFHKHVFNQLITEQELF